MNPFFRVGPSARTSTKLLSNVFRTAVPQPSQRPYSFESYGGDGEPRGSKETGKSEATRRMEHPGPPPPDVSKGSSSSSSSTPKPESKSGSAPSPESPNSQKPPREAGTFESMQTPQIPSNKAHPTLNDGKQSPNVDEHGDPKPDVPEDVKRHNEELDHRYDRAYNKIGDAGKVEKGFWKEDRH